MAGGVDHWVDCPFVGGVRRSTKGGPFCYAKRPQKPADHDLHVGERHRHDRPGAYGHPANESGPLAHNSCRPKLIAPSELAEASVGRNPAYAEAIRARRRGKKRARQSRRFSGHAREIANVATIAAIRMAEVMALRRPSLSWRAENRSQRQPLAPLLSVILTDTSYRLDSRDCNG